MCVLIFCLAASGYQLVSSFLAQQDRDSSSQRGKTPSLLRVLIAAYGRPFFALGGLKLANDALNFAGPLLLNALLCHLSSSAAHGRTPPPHLASGVAANSSAVGAGWHSFQGCMDMGGSSLNSVACGPQHTTGGSQGSSMPGSHALRSSGGASGMFHAGWLGVDAGSPLFGYVCVALLAGSLVLKVSNPSKS
jgi:hypothetical protein